MRKRWNAAYTETGRERADSSLSGDVIRLNYCGIYTFDSSVGDFNHRILGVRCFVSVLCGNQCRNWSLNPREHRAEEVELQEQRISEPRQFCHADRKTKWPVQDEMRLRHVWPIWTWDNSHLVVLPINQQELTGILLCAKYCQSCKRRTFSETLGTFVWVCFLKIKLVGWVN